MGKVTKLKRSCPDAAKTTEKGGWVRADNGSVAHGSTTVTHCQLWAG